MIQEIVYTVGGTLTLDLATASRPASATATLLDAAGTTLTASPTVAVDSVSTTLSAAADEGDETLSVASATGIAAGRTYAVLDTDGQLIEVDVRSVSGTTVTLAEPLRVDLTSGSALYARRVTITVASTYAETLETRRQCVVIVTHADASVTRHVITWEVVRVAWPASIATYRDFRRYASGNLATAALEAADESGGLFLERLTYATEAVRDDIRRRGLRPGLFRDYSHFVRPVVLRVVLQWAKDGVNIPASFADDPDGWIDRRTADYQDALSEALDVADYDADESGDVTEREATARWSSVRILT